MTILIVDDERLVRVTLQSMLEELYANENDIRQVKSAAEMFRIFKQEPIDLIFLDINMPRIKGLEAMELAKKQKQAYQTKWCILTGYSYFEYAKKALDLGASGYILKPPDPTELKNFVDQIKLEKQKERQKEHIRFAEEIRKSLYLDQTIAVQEKGSFQLYTFFVDTWGEEERRKIYNELYNCLDQYISEKVLLHEEKYGLFFWFTGELCAVVKGGPCSRLHSFLKLHFNSRQAAVITGYTKQLSDIRDIKLELKVMLGLASQRFYLSNLTISDMKMFERDTGILEKQYFIEELEKITSKYLSGDWEGFQYDLKIMKTDWIQKNGSYLTPEVFLHLSAIWNADMHTADLEALLAKLKELFYLKNLKEDSRQDMIGQIKSYVENNYMEDVSIARIGEVFHITPTYLSRLFREKTNQKYIDYVTKVRMQKAKLLLEQSEIGVKTVSELVGYASEKHFSKIFKKVVGENPSQYRMCVWKRHSKEE